MDVKPSDTIAAIQGCTGPGLNVAKGLKLASTPHLPIVPSFSGSKIGYRITGGSPELSPAFWELAVRTGSNRIRCSALNAHDQECHTGRLVALFDQ